MTIELEKIKHTRNLLQEKSDQNSAYARKLTSGMSYKFVSMIPFTKNIIATRNDEAHVFAVNADLIDTALNLIDEFTDYLDENGSENKLSDSLESFISEKISIRKMPDCDNDYERMGLIFCLAAQAAFEKTTDRHGNQILNCENEDLERLKDNLARSSESFAIATTKSPPDIINLF